MKGVEEGKEEKKGKEDERDGISGYVKKTKGEIFVLNLGLTG